MACFRVVLGISQCMLTVIDGSGRNGSSHRNVDTPFVDEIDNFAKDGISVSLDPR